MRADKRYSTIELSIRTPRMLAGVFLASGMFLTGCAVGSAGSSKDSQFGFQRALLDEEMERLPNEGRDIPLESLAHYNFMRGELALADENYSSALKFFEAATKYDEKSSPTLRKRIAQMYVRVGKLDLALAELDKALANDEQDADVLQLKAGILATTKRTKEAIATYQKVISISPASNEDPYVLLASLYAQDGDFTSARKVLGELISKNNDSFFGHYYLARMSEADGDAIAAEQSYLKAIALNPNAESVKLDLARVYGVQKRFPDAIAVCEELVKNNPRNVAARNMLGQLLLGDNKLDQAIEQFETLGKLEEDPTETRFKIALIKVQRRDLDGAINDLSLIVAEHPENSVARYYLGSAYAGLKRTQDGLAELNKIEKGQEFYLESRVLVTALLQQEKRFDAALVALNEVTAERPTDVKLLTLRASLERDAGRKDDAVQTLRKILEVEPDRDAHYFTLGVFLDELDRKDEAFAAMRKAIELNPKNANALNYLGYSYAERGENLKEAEELVRRAVELEPKNGFYLDSLGWIHFKAGRTQDALREMERAVGLVSNDAVILEHYAVVLKAVGRHKKALEFAKKAMLFVAESDDKEVGERLKKLIGELEKR